MVGSDQLKVPKDSSEEEKTKCVCTPMVRTKRGILEMRSNIWGLPRPVNLTAAMPSVGAL